MGKKFDKIVVVVLENHTQEAALGNPYLNKLREKGVFLSNSWGVAHPSQPNYIAMIAGNLMGIEEDTDHYVDIAWNGTTYDFSQEMTIVDLIENSKHDWKCFVEDLPEDYQSLKFKLDESPSENLAYLPAHKRQFCRRHVPFLSFPSIVSNPDRLAKIQHVDDIVDTSSAISNPFLVDPVESLADVNFYIPNLYNDGHTKKTGLSTLLGQIETFLRIFTGNDPVKKFGDNTLLAITFDEAFLHDGRPAYNCPNHIYTLLIGGFLETYNGMHIDNFSDHYTLLRSIEENFGLGSLPSRKKYDPLERGVLPSSSA